MPAGDLRAAMESLRTALAAAMPGRVVSRAFRPLAQRTEAELRAGVLCVVALGESDYATHRGREADLGTLKVLLVGQIMVAPKLGPEAVEDAEFVMAEQIKAFLAGDLPVRQCLARSFRQSGQLDAPNGWVVFECEVRT